MTPELRLQPVGRLLAAALLVAGPALAGCSASMVGDHLPTSVGGLPEQAPQRPAVPAPYPAVNDLPPKREATVLSYEEQKKLEDDLVAARKRATDAGAAAAASDGGAAAKPTAGSAGTPDGGGGKP